MTEEDQVWFSYYFRVSRVLKGHCFKLSTILADRKTILKSTDKETHLSSLINHQSSDPMSAETKRKESHNKKQNNESHIGKA